MLGGDSEYLILKDHFCSTLCFGKIFNFFANFQVRWEWGAFIGCSMHLYLPVSKLQRTNLEFRPRKSGCLPQGSHFQCHSSCQSSFLLLHACAIRKTSKKPPDFVKLLKNRYFHCNRIKHSRLDSRRDVQITLKGSTLTNSWLQGLNHAM